MEGRQSSAGCCHKEYNPPCGFFVRLCRPTRSGSVCCDNAAFRWNQIRRQILLPFTDRIFHFSVSVQQLCSPRGQRRRPGRTHSHVVSDRFVSEPGGLGVGFILPQCVLKKSWLTYITENSSITSNSPAAYFSSSVLLLIGGAVADSFCFILNPPC